MSEDTLSAPSPKAPTDTSSFHPPTPNRWATSLVVAGLGVNALLVCVGWPALVSDAAAGNTSLGLTLVALLALAVGVATLLRDSQATARWSLLCAFPAAIGCSLAVVPEAALERAHGPSSLSLAVLALLAHCAGSIAACRPNATSLPLASRPLAQTGSATASAPNPPDPQPAALATTLLRGLVVSLLLAGAFAIAVLAPTLPSYGQVEAAWGDSARAGAVLAAVVAGALATSLLALHLGTLLRLSDTPPTPSAPERRMRVALALFVSVLGAVVYYTIS